MTKKFDVIVVGGGVVGAALSLGLLQQGMRVALLDLKAFERSNDAPAYDVRVSSINLASINIFKQLNVWQQIQRVFPYREIYVWQSEGAGAIHFDSGYVAQPYLGYIIEHRELIEALFSQLNQQSLFQYICPDSVEQFEQRDDTMMVRLKSGGQFSCRLLVGADGGRSQIRQSAGITVRRWPQKHQAIVTTVSMEQNHQATAWQRFLKSGPLAFLPLDNNTCSIVWSTHPDHAKQLMALPQAEFEQALYEAIDGRFGRLRCIGPRAQFPLHPQLARQYVKPRLALAGDAAHTIHPLAGQGVNLGLLDAAALIHVIASEVDQRRDFGMYHVLRRYERWRKGHNFLMLQVMEGFAKLFGTDDPMLGLLRGIGLDLTNHTIPLKRFFIESACGLRGDLPPLAINPLLGQTNHFTSAANS